MTQRVALVTGGTGTIGTEICRQLGAAGHRVVATCLPAEADAAKAWQAEQKQAGHDIAVVPCDLTDFEATAAAVKTAEQQVGPIDVLVNVAGITRDASLRKMTPEQWHAVIQSNLDSVFNATRNVIEGMLDRGFGRVIAWWRRASPRRQMPPRPGRPGSSRQVMTSRLCPVTSLTSRRQRPR